MKKLINKKTLILISLLLLLPLLVGCFSAPPTNQSPTITSTPITTATVAAAYAYNVNATDPDGDTLTYSLTTNPTSMTIDSTTGVINWTPTSTQIGDHDLTVEVSDGELLDTQSFIITVTITPTPVAVTGVTLDQATMTLIAGGATGTITKTVTPANATNKNVIWSSSDEAVATVAGGAVTPLTEGTTTITVTTVDGSFTATCAVTVTVALGQAPVLLGSAGNFVILAKSGISTTGVTSIVGDIGVSPADATYITGFGLILDSSNEFSTSSLVTGKVYAADYAPPTPANMTTAVSDMETAFTDAAGRTLPDYTELGAGDISGMTLVPGLYKWGTGVLITSAGVTLSGGANDVWIFQIAEGLTVENDAMVTLSGGAQAKNIFWQVSGQATLGTAADFKGIILSQTLISLNTGAVLNGRALAQSEVTLIANTITKPN